MIGASNASQERGGGMTSKHIGTKLINLDNTLDQQSKSSVVTTASRTKNNLSPPSREKPLFIGGS